MNTDEFYNFPEELRKLKQWVNWKYVIVNTRKTKVPYQTNGQKAQTDNPDTWSIFEDVINSLDNFDGIGFVFTSDDNYCGIDYDHVKNGDEWVDDIYNEILSYNSYAELSPSGEGAHVIVMGEVPGDKHRKGVREMYDCLRFFTVSGNHIKDTPKTINIAQKQLNVVYKHIDVKTNNGQARDIQQSDSIKLTDDQIISLCMSAKNADKFELLWSGSTTGYDSHSDADMALVSILSFYTQDELQIDHLFSKSGLYRNKWDRDDYRKRTIGKALSGLSDVYKPINNNMGTTKQLSGVVSESINNPMQIAATIQNNIPIWYDASRNYWMWNKLLCKYDRVDETDILCQIMEGLNVADIYKAKTKNEILESIRLIGRSQSVKTTPKNWIQFQNGVIDIETGKEFLATSDYFFAACIPHKLGDDEETPVIDSLFEAWVGKDKKQLLYEICAYCLYDDYPIHRIFCFIGVGRNGKGQFMTLIRRFIGLDNCTSTELDRLSQTQFEASKLYKKKAAFVGETNFGTMSRTNILKQLSGGDLISCEFKRADAFDFYNTAKMIIATNSLPPTTDRTEGFYRRWLIIEFNNRFSEGKDIINTIPEYEYDNLSRKCVRILKELLERGTFTAEGTVEERAQAYEKKSNPVTTFIDDCCIIDSDLFTPTWFLFEKYKDFQDRGGHRRLTEKEFSMQLKTLGYEIDQKAYTSETKRQYYVEPNEDSLHKRSNWRTVLGVAYKTTNESVAGVADVEGTSTLFHIHEKLTENSATSATPATICPKTYNWLKDWEYVYKKSINSSNCVSVAMEYCQKFNESIDIILPVIKKYAKIYESE